MLFWAELRPGHQKVRFEGRHFVLLDLVGFTCLEDHGGFLKGLLTGIYRVPQRDL